MQSIGGLRWIFRPEPLIAFHPQVDRLDGGVEEGSSEGLSKINQSHSIRVLRENVDEIYGMTIKDA